MKTKLVIFGLTGDLGRRKLLPALDSLLEKNENILTNTMSALGSQIQQTTDPSHQKPLELQKKRLQIQLEELQKMKQILASYQEKLV